MKDTFKYNPTWANAPFTKDGLKYTFDPTLPVPVPEDHEDFGKTLGQILGMSEEECIVLVDAQTLSQIREHRNYLLIESDWTQVGDVPDTIKQPWLVYRQELRDITENYSDVSNVQWPTKP